MTKAPLSSPSTPAAGSFGGVRFENEGGFGSRMVVAFSCRKSKSPEQWRPTTLMATGGQQFQIKMQVGGRGLYVFQGNYYSAGEVFDLSSNRFTHNGISPTQKLREYSADRWQDVGVQQ